MNKIYNVSWNGNDATRHGQKYEPEAIKYFEKQYNTKVRYPGFLIHKDYHWLGGTVDGIATLPITKEEVVIEVKCPFKNSIKRHEIPKYYIAQVQVYLEITNLEKCLFIQYKPPPKQEFYVIEILRDRKYFMERIGILKSFWDKLHWWFTVKEDLAISSAIVIQRWWRKQENFSSAYKNFVREKERYEIKNRKYRRINKGIPVIPQEIDLKNFIFI